MRASTSSAAMRSNTGSATASGVRSFGLRLVPTSIRRVTTTNSSPMRGTIA